MEHGWCWWQWSSVAVKLVVQVVMLVKLMVEIAYTPKNITFNNVIRALCIVGKVEEAMSVLVLMRWGSSVPTKNSFNILISEVNRQGRQLSACNVYGAALKIRLPMSKMMMVLTLFHPRLSFTRSAGDVGKALVIVVFKALFPSAHHRVLGRTKAQGQGQDKEAGNGGIADKMIEMEALW
ncbi:hypothetical protein HYC85_026777 [Camellia sinensis]|uniref:Pentatricopeptide repeat-containing protein n=1 Tax=Camellia sinensis TaxID=4442 RepID=A0A7J7G874_CAMSI|nr:hypothetical protein HYC85_026777 [Camellia sinensis]